jgi:ornithine decarboxylase
VDGLEPNYSVLRSPLLPPPTADEACSVLPCRLWGNSDRDGDVVHKAALLPPLRDGDWLMFPYAGAYTVRVPVVCYLKSKVNLALVLCW